MLTLPIKKRWFDMIMSGEKQEEYRADTPYYRARFARIFDLDPEALHTPSKQKIATIRLRNGYAATAPSILACCLLQHGKGRPEWGADPKTPCFILKIMVYEEEPEDG